MNCILDTCELWTDNAVMVALAKPLEWRKYRFQLDKNFQIIQVIRNVNFNLFSPKANSFARDIVCSVIKDRRFTSYLALGELS